MKWDRAQLAAWLVVALCVCGFAWFILANSAFNNDDLDNFLTVRKGNILRLMIMPMTGGHWSPFHRFSSWLVYSIAPMRYGVAVAILILFHVGTLIYLQATLRLLGLKVADKVILCMYASCALLIYGMIWWANAQLRVPHVMLCAAAIFHYVAWLKGRPQRHLWLAAAAYLLDMLVYQKAVLIPVYMMVIGYFSEPTRFRVKSFSAAALPAALLVVSLVFTAVFKYLSPPQLYPPAIKDILHMEWSFLSALSSGVMGLMVNNIKDLGTAYVVRQQYETALILLVLLVASLWASPRTWKLWIALLGVLVLDYLPVSTSSRVLFGAVAPYSYRYHFETVYLVAMFAGLFCVQISRDRQALSGTLGTKVLPIVVVVIYLGVNIASLAIAREEDQTIVYKRKAHLYMANLRDGLERIKEPDPTFVDSAVPWYMAVLVGPRRTEQLVPLFIPAARFTSADNAHYRVLLSGEVIAQPPP
jgi:hypothetical protein